MTSPAAEAANDRPRRRLITQLWFWVLVAIAAGIVFGLVAPAQAKKAKWLADAFIQLIKTITGPVIFVTVVIGIASLGNLARAGGLALRALGYFFARRWSRSTLGLLAGNIVEPGAGFSGKATADGLSARRSRSARRAATRASSASSPATCSRTASSARSSRTRSCRSSCWRS